MNFRLQIPTFFLLQYFLASEATIILRCQCFQFLDKVPPNIIKNFQILPKSTHCSRAEIILTVQQDNKEQEVCLNPELKQGKRVQMCWERSIENDLKKMRECIKTKPKKGPKKNKRRGQRQKNSV
ncbi:C-X-C motif chemokine 3-like [Carcharodon carcharias]|uniref:C-X-C motif chemokine 3-like n=1 Tax=Carcharodon carcharias TaxID=13397 RepID=UPI001B7E3BFF|nr:C-X-C motif chemokine 3-like [Carcharodon carcharias]